ncbi:MAG: di-heme oxidoredictase family protein [Candidatus Thiodiazotropha sp.]
MNYWLVPILLCMAWPAWSAPEVITTNDTSRRAYLMPMRGLNEQELARFNEGRGLFTQMWVIAPSRDTRVDGLGPLYNRISCVACHPDNGRGRAPDGPEGEMRSMLVRLSIPGPSPHGGPRPHPVYGAQLNEQGVPGVPGEGRAEVRYQESVEVMADGMQVSLRRPELHLTEEGYGEFGPLLTSPRIGPAITGMGLLEAVSEEELLSWADPDDRDGDGISGRPNLVWDVAYGKPALGRFGYKANVATLRQQIAGAFIGDLGITSSLHRTQNCTSDQTACQQAINGGEPELSDTQLDDITFYHQVLAVPERRDRSSSAVTQGEALFHQTGCAACHRPRMRTSKQAQPARLADQIIEPYSDLLLHDLGEPLSDGRRDFQASGREWRTAPLWGIGLAEIVADEVGYLHDGRARNLLEAILWHGGEAAGSRERFKALDSTQRDRLLTFLKSL